VLNFELKKSIVRTVDLLSVTKMEIFSLRVDYVWLQVYLP